MSARPQRRWLQFSLRGLFIVTLAFASALGLFAWRFRGPFAERGYHANGKLMWEIQWVKDLHGRRHELSNTLHYSNGQQASDEGPEGTRWWFPDGTPMLYAEPDRRVDLAPRAFLSLWLSDKGDGTFREPGEIP